MSFGNRFGGEYVFRCFFETIGTGHISPLILLCYFYLFGYL
jgi:hypothetical protein